MRKFGRKRKYNVWKTAYLLAGCLLFVGCGIEQEEEDSVVVIDWQEEVVYHMDQVSRGDLVRTADIRCAYRQTKEEEVKISGFGKTLEEVYVRTGDTVKKGQLLAVLSGGDREAEIRDLEYRIARNKLLLGYTEMDEAYDLSYRWWIYVYQSSGSESEKEALDKEIEAINRDYRYQREDYQDVIDVDTLRLESLRREMEESRIYASIDGEVSYMTGELVGKTISEERTLMKIVDSSHCIFESSQVEYAGYFREGEAIELTMNLGGEKTVVTVVPYDMEHWEEALYFEMVDGDAMAIPVGTGGTLYVAEDSREQVLTVAKNALFAGDAGYYVYVLDENNVRQVRWVETGLWGDLRTEIISGLAEGEYVVVR